MNPVATPIPIAAALLIGAPVELVGSKPPLVVLSNGLVAGADDTGKEDERVVLSDKVLARRLLGDRVAVVPFVELLEVDCWAVTVALVIIGVLVIVVVLVVVLLELPVVLLDMPVLLELDELVNSTVLAVLLSVVLDRSVVVVVLVELPLLLTRIRPRCSDRGGLLISPCGTEADALAETAVELPSSAK